MIVSLTRSLIFFQKQVRREFSRRKMNIAGNDFFQKILLRHLRDVTLTFLFLSFNPLMDDVVTSCYMKGETSLTQIVGEVKKWEYSSNVVKRYLKKVNSSLTWLQFIDKLKYILHLLFFSKFFCSLRVEAGNKDVVAAKPVELLGAQDLKKVHQVGAQGYVLLFVTTSDPLYSDNNPGLYLKYY